MGVSEDRVAAAEDRADAAEGRADAADAKTAAAELVTHTAQSVAERLDKLNRHLTIQNQRMRDALSALAQAIEEILIVVDDNEIQYRVRAAIDTARTAFREDSDTRQH